jgi:uncharacterized membrane protein YczE
MAKYVPWYLKRSPPVFCWPCVPVYTGIWPGRKFVLIIGAVLFAIGVMLLLGLLLTCIAVECSIVAGALLPFALILLLVGILLFHCGWAAHLLDRGGAIPVDETLETVRTKRTADNRRAQEEEEIFETIEPLQPQAEVKVGHWQFDQDRAWQTVANPYPIQHTLKPVVERPPYV